MVYCSMLARSRIRFPGRSNRTLSNRMLATAVMLLWNSKLRCIGANPRRSYIGVNGPKILSPTRTEFFKPKFDPNPILSASFSPI